MLGDVVVATANIAAVDMQGRALPLNANTVGLVNGIGVEGALLVQLEGNLGQARVMPYQFNHLEKVTGEQRDVVLALRFGMNLSSPLGGVRNVGNAEQFNAHS